MSECKAIIFDLYGTLLNFKHRSLIKDLASYLNIPPSHISDRLLREYVLCSFENNTMLIVDLLKFINVEVTQKIIDDALLIIEKHVNSVTIVNNACNTLNFFKAKGYKLGLVSNLSIPFKAPFYKFNLDKLFNSFVFSCNCGFVKPNDEIYDLICKNLEVDPQDCLFVGDSLQNDYLAPLKYGMDAILIKEPLDPHVDSIPSIFDLAWSTLIPKTTRLVYSGKSLDFQGNPYTLGSLNTLPDSEVGRYNVIAKTTLRKLPDSDRTQSVYIKRFALHGTAPVEKLAFDICNLLGVSDCKADIICSEEPLLITSEVLGDKWNEKFIPELAYQVGQYAAIAYIFANADFRQHNSIVQQCCGSNKLQMIDMEHYFFNIALDLTGLDNAYHPDTFNLMSPTEFSKRRKRTVLTHKHGRRARQSFIPDKELNPTVQFKYMNGWVSVYEKMNQRSDEIENLLRTRVRQAPYLLIGTQAYRRAMSEIDVDEIMLRSKEDPEKAYLITI